MRSGVDAVTRLACAAPGTPSGTLGQ
jgi:hypothetical protein